MMAGPIRRKLDADLEALVNTHPFGETLSQSARMLSARLDADFIPKGELASVHKELRETLAELAKAKVEANDPFGDSLSHPVSTEVRHPPDA